MVLFFDRLKTSEILVEKKYYRITLLTQVFA